MTTATTTSSAASGASATTLIPGLKPFGEIVGNVREHDQQADRNGYLRNSSGGSVRAGTSSNSRAS